MNEQERTKKMVKLLVKYGKLAGACKFSDELTGKVTSETKAYKEIIKQKNVIAEKIRRLRDVEVDPPDKVKVTVMIRINWEHRSNIAIYASVIESCPDGSRKLAFEIRRNAEPDEVADPHAAVMRELEKNGVVFEEGSWWYRKRT